MTKKDGQINEDLPVLTYGFAALSGSITERQKP